MRSQGTSLGDTFLALDVVHGSKRVCEDQVRRPFVEGPYEGPEFREVGFEHSDDPAAVPGVEGVFDVSADGNHAGRPELMEAPGHAGHDVAARGGRAALLPESHSLP